MNTLSTIDLVLLIMAVWRLSNLLANEVGPFYMFEKLRRRVGVMEARSRRKHGFVAALHLYEGVNCEYCNSVWFGAAVTVAYLIMGQVIVWALLPLSLSTGAIIIKHVVNIVGSVDKRYDQQNQWFEKTTMPFDLGKQEASVVRSNGNQ